MAARKKYVDPNAAARSAAAGKTGAADGNAALDGAGEAAAPAARPTAPAQLRIPIGQGAAFDRLVTAARALRLHHAVVVSGAPGTGKSTAARWLAAALLCPSDVDDAAPCGMCRHCRRVATGQHPDLHVLRPAEGKQITSIDAVRALQETLSLSAVEGRARVVLIDPAEALNEEGQNALLKTLEEPGVRTFLLLCTSRPEQLLPTVRSRCERLVLRGLPRERIAQELSLRAADFSRHHERALAVAHGSLGRALACCTERAVQLHDLVLATFSGAKELRPVATAREVLEGSEGRADAVQRARAFLQFCAGEAAHRLSSGLASAADGSYLPAASEPWASVLELALQGLQDLELQIPADQAVAGALLGMSRLLRAAPG